MADHLTDLYFGEDFAYAERKPLDVVIQWLADGSVEEAKMPTPTRRNPDKYKTVFRWVGYKFRNKFLELHDMSATMPPSVTERAADGCPYNMEIAASWA